MEEENKKPKNKKILVLLIGLILLSVCTILIFKKISGDENINIYNDHDESGLDINEIGDSNDPETFNTDAFETREDTEEMTKNPFILKGKMVVGDDIKYEDIKEFYYTYENINYGALYLRYRFYKDNDKNMFFFEKRERPNDYGPAGEDDTVAKGNIELTDEQLSEFYKLISGGLVRKRGENADSGDCGPWLYLYWNDDRNKYQEFTFESYSKESEFEDYCSQLSGIDNN